MSESPTAEKTESSDVLFLPDWRDGNPYQDLLACGIRATGLKVDFVDYPTGEMALWKAAKAHRGIRVLHLHWINPLLPRIFWSGSPFKARIRMWIVALNVLLIRLRGVRVVWTVHNRLSHESPDPERELAARRCLARASSKLIFHSESARAAVEEALGMELRQKSEVIPHGNYVGVYRENKQREEELARELGVRPGDRVLLFFGAIRRYKGIVTLIEGVRSIADDSVKLIIAGRPFEPDLEADIRAAARADPRIIPYLGFISENDVHPLYSLAHLAVVPFERTLTSGSAILALSMGKALLLPEEARVIGLPDFSGTAFFQGKEGLSQVLSALDRGTLERMGQHNRLLAEKLNWDDIGFAVARVYGL